MIPVLDFLDNYIDKAIYVWGGQGENVCQQEVDGILDPEGWIRSKETSDTYADRAIKLYRKRIADGIDPVICVDCSGLVVEMLRSFGILKPNADRNTKGLYAMCNSHPTRDKLKLGDFVFRSSEEGVMEKITHIGIYVGDGKVVEAKGRAYGVVKTDINSYGWNMYGRMTKLQPFCEDIPDEPEYPEEPMPLAVCKPALEGEGYRTMQEALNRLGYTDSDGVLLAADGKWGKKSRQALDKLMALNLGTIHADVTLHIDGIGDIKV